MRLHTSILGLGLLPALISTAVHAADTGDKSKYSIVNPTPKEQMRPMVSDQAMFTLTPYTVDAGHYQIETDLYDYFYTHDKSGGGNTKLKAWSVGRMTIKAGMCDRVDFGLSFTAYQSSKVENLVTGKTTKSSGFSDLTAQMKINLWGNEGGTTALCIVPFVGIPTSTARKGPGDYDGGILVPFTWHAPGDFTVCLNTGFDMYKNVADDMHATWINGISLRRTLCGGLSAYAEFSTHCAEESAPWDAVVNGGLAYQVTSNIEVNAGITRVVQGGSLDYNPYLGLSWRF
jgi:hypothetical protein